MVKPVESENLVICPEDALTPQDVTKLIPFVVSYVTVTRWMREGYKGIKLRAVRFGSKWATTRALVNEFIDKVNALGSEPAEPVAKLPRKRSTAAERSKSHRRADDRLRAAGM